MCFFLNFKQCIGIYSLYFDKRYGHFKVKGSCKWCNLMLTNKKLLLFQLNINIVPFMSMHTPTFFGCPDSSLHISNSCRRTNFKTFWPLLAENDAESIFLRLIVSFFPFTKREIFPLYASQYLTKP